MPRFSLDNTCTFRDINNADDESLSSGSSYSSSSHDHYHDSDDSDDEEPHPLGFGHHGYGSTRFGLYTRSTSSSTGNLEDYNDHDYEIDVDLDALEHLDAFFEAPVVVHRRPMLKNSRETGILLKHDYRRLNNKSAQDEYDSLIDPLVDRMDRIAILVKAASSMQQQQNDDGTSRVLAQQQQQQQQQQQLQQQPPRSHKFQALIQAAEEQHRAEQNAKLQIEEYSKQLFKRQKEDAQLLLNLIKRDEAEADIILQAERRQEEAVLDAQRLEREERDLADKERDLADKSRQKEEDRIAKQQSDQLEKEQYTAMQKEERDRTHREEREQKKADKEATEAKKTEYITNAKKMVEKLDYVRSSLEVFNTSKDRTISTRRLQMKKIARGKMNTLSHEKEKVEMVTRQVVEALQVCTQEDLQLKQQINSGNTAITREMTRGTRYLMDLVASTVIVRVQAEGFNG